ncbi:GAP family protein [Pseudanabaena sp. BC1403]|uniref:GAP family protein n=1 Tax=Pseudanabaena sp. BC1403 TaxID=2043171 RepID=UPI000CD985E0|nr:GAP family protein [Pseudanabaena sp. BC1403]
MSALLPSLIAIAALDSLNPSAIALQVYLLGTTKPIPRSLAFVIGIFLAYWTSGLLAVLGLNQFIQTVIANSGISLSTPLLYTIQLLIGIILLVVGITLRIPAQTEPVKAPTKLTLARTFLLGMSVTVLELPTALPYFAAIEQIARANLDLLSIASILALYNLIFVLPPIALVVLYLLFHRQSFVLSLLQRINRSIAIYSPHILRFVLLGLGIFLIADCFSHSLAFTFGNPSIKLP